MPHFRTRRGRWRGPRQAASRISVPGCPHNRSTVGARRQPGARWHLAALLAQWMDRNTTTFTQMGGEGAAGLGRRRSPAPHVFVGLGDGAYAHSGLLAIRAAIASGVTMTYKVLFNDAVAMTRRADRGGRLQRSADRAPARGRGRAQASSDCRGSRASPRADRAAGGDRRSRDRLRGRSSACGRPRGLVLIYDQICAAEKRRRRQRGQMADAGKRIVINEAVCEGCGDCGRSVELYVDRSQ